jgi:hypothetical protein
VRLAALPAGDGAGRVYGPGIPTGIPTGFTNAVLERILP